jgi:hypothetical protein
MPRRFERADFDHSGTLSKREFATMYAGLLCEKAAVSAGGLTMSTVHQGLCARTHKQRADVIIVTRVRQRRPTAHPCVRRPHPRNHHQGNFGFLSSALISALGAATGPDSKVGLGELQKLMQLVSPSK